MSDNLRQSDKPNTKQAFRVVEHNPNKSILVYVTDKILSNRGLFLECHFGRSSYRVILQGSFLDQRTICI